MAFFKRSKSQNYDVFSGYAWHVPGIAGMFGMLGWLLVGAILGGIVLMVIKGLIPSLTEEYQTLITYPIMFIPAMIAAKTISNRNMMFDPGYAIDNNHFGRLGGWVIALLCMVATFAAGFCMDAVNSQMPPMPDWLEQALGSLTEGTFLINFLAVSIFAPIFEEWLCRGTVLRGLLNYQKADGTRGLKPGWAIVISALFFAVIHMNPWQAIPAFALGLLFGYVYYKTGSLKLTMLMHFTNNTAALLLSQYGGWDEDIECWTDVMPLATYIILFVIFAAFLVWFVLELGKIGQQRPQGNCDELTFDPESA